MRRVDERRARIGHTRESRRPSCLRAVRVHQGGTHAAHQARDRAHRPGIRHGRDRAHHVELEHLGREAVRRALERAGHDGLVPARAEALAELLDVLEHAPVRGLREDEDARHGLAL